MTINIRKLDKNDEIALINICWITGDQFLKKVFPEPNLFAMFWCLYYVWYETNNCFVAVDTKTQEIVGYILNAKDTLFQEQDFKLKMGTMIKSKIKELKIKSLRTKIIAHYLINKPLTVKRKKFLKKYPAHLHIDIIPEYQRKGIGHRLMNSLETHLREKNVFGFHLEVSAKNQQGINFYQKYGLTLVSKNRFNYIFTKKL